MQLPGMQNDTEMVNVKAEPTDSKNSVAPREVSLTPSEKKFPDGYDDTVEYSSGISCCGFCSVPTGAKWLFYWSAFMVILAFVQLIYWFTMNGTPSDKKKLYLPIYAYVMNMSPATTSLMSLYNAKFAYLAYGCIDW